MTPNTISIFSRLGNGSWLDDVSADSRANILKGTPFYSKRTTLLGSQLQNKPLYRTLSLLNKIAVEYGVPEQDWADFLNWSEQNMTSFEREHHDEAKKFIRTYGSSFQFQRMLLTTKNAINLYIKENKGR
jgi:hypothetical protein